MKIVFPPFYGSSKNFAAFGMLRAILKAELKRLKTLNPAYVSS